MTDTTEQREYSFDEVALHVREALAEVKEIPADSIDLDATFEQLDVDSLDATELLFLMEDKLGIDMPDAAARAMRNVRQVVEAVQTLLRGEELVVPEPETPDATTPAAQTPADQTPRVAPPEGAAG